MTAEPITARMADSTKPAEIPDLFRLRPNGVAPYIDGDYAWPPDVVALWPRVWRISTTGRLDLAPHARVLDVERFDATPKEVEPYRLARAERGELTITYCNRDTVPQVTSVCPGWQELEWFIATLDGQPWTPASLSSWIRSSSGVYLEPARIRAIQVYPMGQYDMSLLFGKPGFQPTRR